MISDLIDRMSDAMRWVVDADFLSSTLVCWDLLYTSSFRNASTTTSSVSRQ